MPGRRFSDEQEKEMCRLYQDGKGAPEIAQAYGCDHQLVYSALRCNGLSARSQQRFKGKVALEIVERYQKGESANQIAVSLKTQASLIINLLKRHKIQIRDIEKAASFKPERFTEEQGREIRRLYEEGFSLSAAGKKFGLGVKASKKAILKYGGILRARGEHNIRFNQAESEEINTQYLAGKSIRSISEEKAASINAVKYALRRTNTPLRSTAEAHGGLSDAQEQELIQGFKSGRTTKELGKEFDITLGTVCRILGRNGLKDQLRESRGGIKRKDEKKACDLYLSGKSSRQIAEKYGVSCSSIIRALKRHKVQMRNQSEAKGGLTQEERSECIRLYPLRRNCSEVARELGCSPSQVMRILREAGVEIKSISLSLGGLTTSQKEEIARRYETGESSKSLGEAFDVSPTLILNAVREFEIEVRAGGGFDSVEQAITGTSRFAVQQTTWFYIFELARYVDTHYKPGIAIDTEVRARQSDGEYGEELFGMEFSSREEAFFLEQALLFETQAYADCPVDLIEWAGASEIRAMDPEDLIAIAIQLSESMEELGLWEFAVAYVPMTKGQLVRCKTKISSSR